MLTMVFSTKQKIQNLSWFLKISHLHSINNSPYKMFPAIFVIVIVIEHTGLKLKIFSLLTKILLKIITMQDITYK